MFLQYLCIYLVFISVGKASATSLFIYVHSYDLFYKFAYSYSNKVCVLTFVLPAQGRFARRVLYLNK